METGNITVDPLAKVKQLRMTDLTRAGKAVTRDMRRQRPANGKMLVSSPTAPDSQTISGAGKPVSCADGKYQCRVGCVGTQAAYGLRDETRPTGPDSQNHLSTDDEKITNHLRAGNTANRGRVLVRGKPLVARKETETELSDAGEEGWLRDRNPKSERPSFVGSVTSGGIPAAVPDSQNPLRFLVERALDEKPSKMDGNT